MHQICLQFVLNTLRSYRDATMVSTSSYLVLRASKTISYCAPLRCAQALRLAALQLISRAGSAAQGKGLFPSLPSIYEPAWAQNRAHADSTCWATFGPPLIGAGFS